MPVTMSNPTFSRYVPVVPYYFASDYASLIPVTWAELAIPSKSSPNEVIISGLGSNAIHILKYDSSFNGVTLSRKITPPAGYSIYIPAGGSSHSYMDVDTSGNIYIMLQASNGSNQYDGLVKMDSSGSVVWQIEFPQDLSFPQNFKVASDGSIYGVVNASGIGITVFKLNSDGTTSWAKNLGWPGEFNPAYLITISESDSMIYLGGVSVVGSQTGHTITKLSMSNGTVQWNRTATFTGRDTQIVSALNVYSNASVVVISGITQDPATPRDEAFLTGLNSSTGLNNFSIRTQSGTDKAMYLNATTIDSGNRMYTVFDMAGTAYLWAAPAGGGVSYRKSMTNTSWYLSATFVDIDQRLGILASDATTSAKLLTKLPTNSALGSGTYGFLPDGSTNVSYVYANTTAFSTTTVTPTLNSSALTTDTSVTFNTSSNSFFTVQAHSYTFSAQQTVISV